MDNQDNSFDEIFNSDETCRECGHAKALHSEDEDGWVSCDADNYSCNCGNNIGR